jgi:hypothetical protein
MSEAAARSERVRPDRRAAFLEQLKQASFINTDAPLGSVLDAAIELPSETTHLTVVYDDAKWYAIMP